MVIIHVWFCFTLKKEKKKRKKKHISILYLKFQQKKKINNK